MSSALGPCKTINSGNEQHGNAQRLVKLLLCRVSHPLRTAGKKLPVDPGDVWLPWQHGLRVCPWVQPVRGKANPALGSADEDLGSCSPGDVQMSAHSVPRRSSALIGGR